MNSLFVLIASLLYSILLITVYFYKQRLETTENKIFKALIITNLIGIMLDIMSIFTVTNMDVIPIINGIVTKAYLVYLHVWICIMTSYIFVVSFKKNNESFKTLVKVHKKLVNIYVLFAVISLILIISLPLYYHNENGQIYSYGPSANLSYIVGGMSVAAWVICMCYNIKNIKSKKYFPMFTFMIIGTIVIIVQRLNPSFLLMTSMETFVTFLMYFTIENPDIKMIEELNKAKDLSEKYNNDKSLLLFNFTQQIKPSLKNILNLSDLSNEEKDITTLRNNMLEINDVSSRILNALSAVFDLSSMDVKKIKVIENEYNVRLLLDEIVLKNKNNIEKKGLDFRINIDEGMPEELYGDYIKLKQVINSLLSNSIKYTDKGFIELNVNSIVKYNVCRLIINIEDSGKGIGGDVVDKYLMNNNKEEPKEVEDNNEVPLNEIKKRINSIGGTIVVKGGNDNGSNITIVIDQKIVNHNDNRVLEELKTYKRIQENKINVMVVDDDAKNLESIAKRLSTEDINIVTVNGGQLCLEKIRDNEQYDLILIDDVLNKLSTTDTLNKLKQIEEFHTPVIIMTDTTDKLAVNMYLRSGFNGVLSKPIKRKEFNKIIHNFAKK